MATKKQEIPERRQTVEDDETGSEDELLAQAAAQWASSKADEASPPSSTGRPQEPHSKQPLSLHVTQLSFDATDYDIRNAFVQGGCVVTSVRLVYDGTGAHKTFRGVAFVDVQDENSYQKALKLDRTTLLGRRINVRPTKTRSELANIVQRTRDLVAEKIRKEREAGESHDRTTDQKKPHGDRKHSKTQKYHKAAHKKANSSHKHKSSKGKDDGDRKLTKKERNRRAAIIMSRERGKT